MKITRIEQIGKYKNAVYLDEEYAFWLSSRELYRWKLKEGIEIGTEVFARICKESVLERCKRKAVTYLKFCDRTEAELRQKLKQQMYLEEIIEQTIAYLYRCGYLDDARYVELFVNRNVNIHSRKWMEMKLMQKGIPREQLLDMLGDEYSEEEPIRRAIQKKMKNGQITDREQREKILAYLYRQGFGLQKSKKILEEYAE